MKTTTLTLPFPPSVNTLFSTNWKTKRRFPSECYEDWKALADSALIGQKAYRHEGVINVEYILTPPDKRRRDLDNYLKPVNDLLQKHQIIKNDSLINILTARWERAGEPRIKILISDSGAL